MTGETTAMAVDAAASVQQATSVTFELEVASSPRAEATEELKKRPLEGDSQPPRVVCLMCKSSDVKYRCPRCERITCSLACCVAHKKQFDCDGKRDRTKYIPTKQFTDSDLSSDFFFLEEISRSTNSAARSRSKLGVNVKRYGAQKPQQKKRRVGGTVKTLAHGETVNPHVPADWLTRFPVAFQLLVQHAAKRGVALTLLAPGMSKRVRNTSYMNTKEGALYWRVEWGFPSAEVAVSLFEERASDALTPFELLDKYLERRPENTGLRSKLKAYATPAWRDDLVLLLRKEFTASSTPQYYRLDGNLSLESNLKRKAVVEFPVITVVLRSELSKYTVVNDLIEVIDTPTSHVDDANDTMDVADDGVNHDEEDDDEGEEVEEEKHVVDDDAQDAMAAVVALEEDEEEGDNAIDIEMALTE